MRTLLLVFLLFTLPQVLFSKSIFDKIDEISKQLTDEYQSPEQAPSLAKKIQEAIDNFKVAHPKPTKSAEEDETLEKFKEFWKKLKQEQEDKINDFKAKIEQKRAEKEAENAQKKEDFQKKWEEFKKGAEQKIDEAKTKINDKINSKNPAKDSKIEPAVQEKSPVIVQPTVAPTADVVAPRSGLFPDNLSFEKRVQLAGELIEVFEGIVNATKIKRKEKFDEFRAEIEPKLKEFFTNFKTKFTEWKTAKKEQQAQIWADMQVILKAIIDKVKTKIQEKNQAKKDFWEKIHQEIMGITADEAQGTTLPVASAEVKATFLDKVTGTSSWQNVTWILLAICVFLTIALLITIFYQTARRNHLYQRLPGDDGPAPPPIYPKLELRQEF